MLSYSSYLPIFIIASISICLSPLTAQPLTIGTGSILYQEGERACVRIEMEPAPKAVKKAWDDYLKKNHDVNLRGIGFLTNKDILSAEAANFAEVSDKVLDVYTRVIEVDQRTEMCVFAALEPDLYLNPETNPAEFNRLQKVVERFLNEYLPDHYGDLVTKSEEKLEDLLDQQKELKDDVADNKREIAKLEKENREKSKNLIDVNAAIKDLRATVDERRQKLREIDRKLKEHQQ